MKKLIIIVLLMAVTALAFISCAGAEKSTHSQTALPQAPKSAPSYQGNDYYDGYLEETGGYGYASSAPAPTPTSAYQPNPTSVPADRMVVRNGYIELVVTDVDKAIEAINRLASDNGGYVVNSRKWKEGERNIGTISIRVQADNYDQTMFSLREMADSVTSESTSSQDVTEEYVDLESKVKNLEASETQLLKIMETAVNTDDVISIQRELTSVRGEIEQARGRMQYLQRTSAASLIEIRLNETMLDLKFSANKIRVVCNEDILFRAEVAGGSAPYSYEWDFGDGNSSFGKSPTHAYENIGDYNVSLKVIDDKGYTNSVLRSTYIHVIDGWNPANIAKDAWAGFLAFGRGLVDVFIYVGVFSPVWLVIGGITWFIIYRKRKKRN
jgi:PKD repeat protein